MKKTLLGLAVLLLIAAPVAPVSAAGIYDAARDELMLGSGTGSQLSSGVADVDTFYPAYDYYLGEHYRAAVEGRRVSLWAASSRYEAVYSSKTSYPAARRAYQTEQVRNVLRDNLSHILSLLHLYRAEGPKGFAGGRSGGGGATRHWGSEVINASSDESVTVEILENLLTKVTPPEPEPPTPDPRPEDGKRSDPQPNKVWEEKARSIIIK